MLSKLKERLSVKTLDSCPPKIIESDFLNDIEIDEIKNKVLSLKEHWQFLRPNYQSVLTTRMLPPGMYSRSFDEYKTIVSQYNPLLYSNFSKIYKKIQARLSAYFNCNLVYNVSTNYPGFHVFAVSEDAEYGEYRYYNFHCDNFGFLKEIVQYNEIYSCIVPISLPQDRGSLLYTLYDIKYGNRVAPNIEYSRMPYEIGDLLIWPGNLLHSIEPFSLQHGEYRITLQMHIALGENEGTIFW